MNRKLIDTVVDGKYHIESLLGEGGGGAVYKANHIDLQRFVAIKMMHSLDLRSPEKRARFEREVEILSRLSHENIVKTLAVGFLDDDSSYYLVLEYLEGKTLARLIQEEGHIDPRRLLKIGIQLCNAIQFAHEQGIIHRDLKPQNIMLITSTDGVLTPKVLDFGFSKLVYPGEMDLQKLTSTGAIIGSLHYMSPETCSGAPADHRSDIYSLGCVLYECLIGSPPFQGDNPFGIMYKHRTQLPDFKKPRLSSFELLISKCMEKQPADRFQSAAELRSALEILHEGNGDLSQLTDKQVRPSSSANKVSWMVALSLAVSLLGCCLLFVFTQRHGLSPQTTLPDKVLSSSSTPDVRAEIMLKNSLARAERHAGTDKNSLKEPLLKLGEFYVSKKRFADAAPILKQLLTLDESFWPLMRLATCYEGQNKFSLAEPLLKRALALREVMLVPNDIQMDFCLSEIAECYEKQAKHSEAETAYKRLVKIKEQRVETSPELDREDILGGVKPSDEDTRRKLDVAAAIQSLAKCYQEQSKYVEAEAAFKNVLVIREKILGPKTALSLEALNNYIQILRCLNRNDEATQLVLQARSIAKFLKLE